MGTLLHHPGAHRRGFSLLEIVLVVVVVGVLSAIVVPAVATITDESRVSALKSDLAGVRGAIARYRTQRLLGALSNPFPDTATLSGTTQVLLDGLPVNPYNKCSQLQSVSSSEAQNRVVKNETAYGWNYYVDNTQNPPKATFYANTSAVVAGSSTRGADL